MLDCRLHRRKRMNHLTHTPPDVTDRAGLTANADLHDKWFKCAPVSYFDMSQFVSEERLNITSVVCFSPYNSFHGNRTIPSKVSQMVRDSEWDFDNIWCAICTRTWNCDNGFHFFFNVIFSCFNLLMLSSGPH